MEDANTPAAREWAAALARRHSYARDRSLAALGSSSTARAGRPTVLRTRRLLRIGTKPSVSFDGVLEFDEGGIRSVRSRPERNPAADFPDTLVMPALSNAHDHGRGLKTIAYGALDNAVEAWIPATYTLPRIDPYVVAAVAFARMARSGITSVVHCHLSADRASLMDAAIAVRRAARDVGLRVAFVVPLRDRNRLGYGPDEAVLACADPADRAAIAQRWLKPIPTVSEQMDLVEAIAEEETPGFTVQYGPVGVEWCSDRMLEAVAERSTRSGRRVHMHLLETGYQREWTDRHYVEGAVRRLSAVGLLSPRLTVAHGTWLRPDEAELLAANGVTVSVNTSSNLRLRSGIAPVPMMKAAGLRIALGLDALALDDDDDMLREMRLARLLHGGWGFERQLDAGDVLAAATRSGACAVCGETALGDLVVGAPADLIMIDYASIGADLEDDVAEPLAVLLARASRKNIRSVYCAGREIVSNGVVAGVDEVELEREIMAQFRAALPDVRPDQPLLQSYQKAIARFYEQGGHLEHDRSD